MIKSFIEELKFWWSVWLLGAFVFLFLAFVIGNISRKGGGCMFKTRAEYIFFYPYGLGCWLTKPLEGGK